MPRTKDFEARVTRQIDQLSKKKNASSAESVGHFWIRKVAKGMKQGDFDSLKDPKTKGFSGSEFCFVVETLDGAG